MTAGGVRAAPEHAPGRTTAGMVRMSGNESPSGPLPAALRVMMDAVRHVHRYPDTASADLVHALAEHLRVPPETVTVGPGSSALLQRLLAAVCTRADDELLVPDPAFQAYTLFAAHADAPVRTVALSPDWAVDLDAVAAAIGPSTRVVVISNPHNPTGTLLGRQELRRFLAAAPEDVLVVLDEAYVEYATEGAADGVALAKEHWAAGHDNVAVTRTFSKAYGLAGLRVGYGIAPPMLAMALAASALPFEVSGVGQAAALASLLSHERMRARCDLTAAERARVLDALREQGFVPPPSHANHVWLPVGEDADRFERHCRDFGIAVLAYPGLGVRITLGSRADNDLMLAAARAWASGGERNP
ncbi:aminotransferase class I/II-fold pyridoxal phosphate-dependent enzyme [Amycolatopsis rubida]|uniref:Histidinol-phosphate aminotransferase n=1 Tax=Amycolatopsis rubida TaxID=112413 RepID=A0A1I5XD05_9PSEU|nr:aminotransferase class I/II-fold pyridoxal phosphate-dependent enzyme [Amycolatopsis rubida]SFQ29848.1 histidinol-phosphate aminotransferase [Amycolatopsis rubida]